MSVKAQVPDLAVYDWEVRLERATTEAEVATTTTTTEEQNKNRKKRSLGNKIADQGILKGFKMPQTKEEEQRLMSMLKDGLDAMETGKGGYHVGVMNGKTVMLRTKSSDMKKNGKKEGNGSGSGDNSEGGSNSGSGNGKQVQVEDEAPAAHSAVPSNVVIPDEGQGTVKKMSTAATQEPQPKETRFAGPEKKKRLKGRSSCVSKGCDVAGKECAKHSMARGLRMKEILLKGNSWDFFSKKMIIRLCCYSMMMFLCLAATKYSVKPGAVVDIIDFMANTDLTSDAYQFCYKKKFEDIKGDHQPHHPQDSSLYCESVLNVDRIAAVDYESLVMVYGQRNIPVIITNGMDDWDVQDKDLRIEDFLFVHGNMKVTNYEPCQLVTNNPIRSNYLRDSLLTMAAFSDVDNWFMYWKNCDNDAINVYSRFHKLPKFMLGSNGTNRFYKMVSDSFLVSNNYMAPTYRQLKTCANTVVMMQIRGSFGFNLVPTVGNCFGCHPIHGILKETEMLMINPNKWMLYYTPKTEGTSIAAFLEMDWNGQLEE